MNIVKKMAIAATVLCFATIANAQDMQFGARLGYSLQSADGGKMIKSPNPFIKVDVNMGLLGLGAGVVANIPAGPVVISPEVDFVTRTVANVETKLAIPLPMEPDEELPKFKISEFAVTIPIMIKFFPMEALYVGAGFQVGIPIGSEMCEETGKKKCEKLDGKTKVGFNEDGWPEIETHAKRNLDLGIPIGVGYMVMPNLGVDFRFVLGLSNIIKADDIDEDTGVKKTVETGSMNTFGLGVTYLF